MSASDDFLKKRLQSTSAQKPQTKPCPYCGEQIMAMAKKCRFCGEMLDTKERVARERASHPQPVNQTVKVETGCANLVTVIITIVILFFLFLIFLGNTLVDIFLSALSRAFG